MDYINEYKRWLTNVTEPDLLADLRSMDEGSIENAFHCDLSFGTGGLRGVIGVGTNRMNTRVVAKASQGLSLYLLMHDHTPSVVIGYDSRIMSREFAEVAAGVFAANGIKIHLWHELIPVPTVSFAVRELGCSAGVMITASHNPSEYNGYKVYGSDGCQITTEVAADILEQIDALDVFADIKTIPFSDGIANGFIDYVDTSVLDAYIASVKHQSVLFGDEVDHEVAIVYTPLNGTGLKPVTRVLAECGFNNITVVEEQRVPDGTFPTCPYPNPEVKETMELGISYCVQTDADLLLATDPDCDRLGIAVRDGGDFRLMTGNEVGLLLLDYICTQRLAHDRMPMKPVFVKTIVTTDLAERIAEHYGVETVNVLTGFKFIGEVIGSLEQSSRLSDFVCAFEESYGYLTGTYVRDKDGVNAALMVCEMFAFYRMRGMSLIQKLEELYQVFGHSISTLHTYQFEGVSGSTRIQEVMQSFRCSVTEIAGLRIVKTEDYLAGVNGLPKSNVLKFYVDGGTVAIRPSGTEPKLKVYICVNAHDELSAKALEMRIRADLEEKMK